MSPHTGGESGTGNAPTDDVPKVIDNATVGSEVTLNGGVLLSRDAVVDGSAHLTGAVEVTEHGHVGASAVISGSVRIDGHGHVTGNASISGEDVHVGDTAVVDENAVVVGKDIDIKARAHVTGRMRIGSGAQLLHKDDVFTWSGGNDGDWTVFRTSGGHANGIEGDSTETILDLINNDRAPHELKREVKNRPFNTK